MKKNKSPIACHLLKMVEFTFFNRSQQVYIRFMSFGKDTKVSLNIKIPKGFDIDIQTGIVSGQAEITKQILTYAQRFETGFRRSILEGIEPMPEWLKAEMFGINHGRITPSLLVVLAKYYEYYYGEKSNLDKKTKEKNEYSKRYIEEWLKVEFGHKTVQISDIKPIHAEKLLYYIINTMSVSKEHSRRTVGFLDRALKFAVKSIWIVSHPFQYVLNEKQFQRQKRTSLSIYQWMNWRKLKTLKSMLRNLQELEIGSF